MAWAPYDPTDLFSESIDPLGFGKGYIELADHLLPGLTTITVVPRYLSMLCAGIDAALKRCPLGSGGDEHKKRLSHLAAYERAWALACTVASQNGLGDSAILGVRGVRSVQRYLLTVGTADRYRTTFNLLSNQIRSGGIGAYASMLAECRLADMQNLTLRPLGVELAQAFPSAGRLDVCADDGDFSKSALREWGGRANPSCITAEESRLLQIALSGEREGGHPDRLRWTALRMLALLPQEAESRLFGKSD